MNNKSTISRSAKIFLIDVEIWTNEMEVLNTMIGRFLLLRDNHWPKFDLRFDLLFDCFRNTEVHKTQ